MGTPRFIDYPILNQEEVDQLVTVISPDPVGDATELFEGVDANGTLIESIDYVAKVEDIDELPFNYTGGQIFLVLNDGTTSRLWRTVKVATWADADVEMFGSIDGLGLNLPLGHKLLVSHTVTSQENVSFGLQPLIFTVRGGELQ